MALYFCVYCGAEIDFYADSCPNCHTYIDATNRGVCFDY